MNSSCDIMEGPLDACSSSHGGAAKSTIRICRRSVLLCLEARSIVTGSLLALHQADRMTRSIFLAVRRRFLTTSHDAPGRASTAMTP